MKAIRDEYLKLPGIKFGWVTGKRATAIRSLIHTGWLWWSHTFVGLTMILVIPLSALFCLGIHTPLTSTADKSAYVSRI